MYKHINRDSNQAEIKSSIELFRVYKIMLAISRLPPRPPKRHESVEHRQYEGDITVNPLEEPVLTRGYPENVGQLKDEAVLNDGGYFLDEGPVLNEIGYLHVEGLYSLGVSDDPSDVKRVDELNEDLVGKNDSQAQTYNDEYLRQVNADFHANRTGRVYNYKRDYTDPADLVYDATRDAVLMDQEATLMNLPVWYLDENDQEIKGEISVYLDDPFIISTLFDQVASTFDTDPSQIDSLRLYRGDHESVRIETSDPELLAQELSHNDANIEVKWKV